MESTTIQLQAPRTLRWTVPQYDRLAAEGFFRDRKVELIEGRVFRIPPQKEPHVLGVTLAHRQMMKVFGEQDYYVRPPAPLRQGKWSKPEPDVAVVAGNMREYLSQENPSTAVLVIEVSDTTLRYDRGRKASLYAKNGIADYWIVNLIHRQVEVHREPVRDRTIKLGYRYGSIVIYKQGDSIAPLRMPDKVVAVAELMP